MTSKTFSRFFTRPAKATLMTLLLGVNILAGVLTVASAYGGKVDPYVSVIPALLSMMLPGFLIGDLVVMLLDFVVKRWKMMLIVLASWLIALPSLLVYSPLNIFPRHLTEAEEEHTFTLLTYNALNFYDFRGEVAELKSNATIDYILSTDADVVSMQEVEFIQSWPLWKVTPEQVQELDRRYPYRVVNADRQLTVLSKYPFEHVIVNVPPPHNIKMALFRLHIKGHTVHLFNVHLESIGLSIADKELYQDLFDKAPSTEQALRHQFHEVKSQLITKLAKAFRNRTDQARIIRHVVDSIGGDFIVAGDFNDIQGCYAERVIMGNDLHDAYAECALGPCITYHGNRFYFRIDHILYGGDMEAVSVKRGDAPSSDHFPLVAKFLFD